MNALCLRGLVIPDHTNPEDDIGSTSGSAGSVLASEAPSTSDKVVRYLVPRGPQVVRNRSMLDCLPGGDRSTVEGKYAKLLEKP